MVQQSAWLLSVIMVMVTLVFVVSLEPPVAKRVAWERTIHNITSIGMSSIHASTHSLLSLFTYPTITIT
jgi:hypothetical protein